MKEIPLTQNKIALVDDEDYERINQYKWYAQWSGWQWRSVRNQYIGKGKAAMIYMHREILNAPKGIPVDHRDGNGLDNRKENLRLCTTQQNARNLINAHKDNRYGIKGVSYNKFAKKFHAQIRVDNKRIHLGYFNVLGDADSAYRKAEEKYFGEFARAI